MKYIKLSAAALTTLMLSSLLCACSKNSDSSSGSSLQVSASTSQSSAAASSAAPQPPESSSPPSAPESSAQSESSPDPLPPPSDTVDFLVGLDGNPVPKRNITTVFTVTGDNILPDDLTRENFTGVICSGFAYICESSVPSRNSIDNADVYDETVMTFADVPETACKGYRCLKEGERYGDLVLSSGEANFALGNDQQTFVLADGSKKTGAELGLPEIYFNGCFAQFSGEFTLTGYACRVAEDDYGINAGDVLFVPNDPDGVIPKMTYELDGDNGFHSKPMTYFKNGFAWVNEYGYIYLGNAYDISADISGLPDDGSFTSVTVTASDLLIRSTLDRGMFTSASLVDIS